VTMSTASSTWRRSPQAQRGGSVSRQRRRQASASGFVHSPTVRSARPEDLRAELNRRRAGQDARITMERARERRLNIEGWNLEAELDTAVLKPQGHVQAPVAGVGCATLANHLRPVAWPSKFWPHLPKKFDRSTNRQNSCSSTSPPSRRLGVTTL
jgi:hypothetical protein